MPYRQGESEVVIVKVKIEVSAAVTGILLSMAIYVSPCRKECVILRVGQGISFPSILRIPVIYYKG